MEILINWYIINLNLFVIKNELKWGIILNLFIFFINSDYLNCIFLKRLYDKYFFCMLKEFDGFILEL